MSEKRKQVGLGHDERAKIRRLREKGLSSADIAGVWELEVEQVERVLAEEGEEESVSDTERVVKRLMKDPEELLCPLSHQLMDDPVVLADGITYERSMVEECLQRMPNKSPMTGLPIANTVLNPSQTVKSLIISFKEERIKEILSLVPKLEDQQALELLKRGEDFVRPLLPDLAAKRKLADLLLFKLKLPNTERTATAAEAMSLLAEVQDDEKLQQAFGGLEAPAVASFLASVDDETVMSLHRAVPGDDPCKELVTLELVCRLARWPEAERLQSLWSLIEASLDEHHSWKEAAACLVASHMGSLRIDLEHLSSEVLTEAARFVDDPHGAETFALDFFNCDLGIQVDSWPDKATARIFEELARRLPERSSERLPLLLKGHGIDESNAALRQALAQELQRNDSDQELEGLYLKLSLEEGKQLPADVLAKLSLEDRHLNEVAPQQLLLLAQQLGPERPHEAASVAIMAAKALTGEEADDAYLQAFHLDPSNSEAAQGLAEALQTTRARCRRLEERCQRLEEASERCHRLEVASTVVWDLSGYDFSRFEKDQQQDSEKFLLPCGVKVWLSVYPKGTLRSSNNMAGLFLNVDKPAVVKWTMKSNTKSRTEDHDFASSFAHARESGRPNDRGWHDFMPASEANGHVTLRILSVQAQHSTVAFY